MAEGKRGAHNREDAETEAIIYQGASIRQLSTIFRMDTRDVKSKMEGLPPVGTRNGYPIYNLREAANKLCAPVIEDMDAFIRKMNHADLPMMLRKEYWAGMRSRQLFEVEDGKLWPEEEVAEVLSELLKTLKMQMLLIRDSVAREVELSEKQQAVVGRYVDSALDKLHDSVKEHFAKRLKRVGDRAAATGHTPEAPESIEDDEL